MNDNSNGKAGTMPPTEAELAAHEAQTVYETESLANFLNHTFMAFMHGHEKLTITASMAGASTFLARSIGAMLDYHAEQADVDTFARFQARALAMIKQVEASVAEIRHVSDRSTH